MQTPVKTLLGIEKTQGREEPIAGSASVLERKGGGCEGVQDALETVMQRITLVVGQFLFML